MAFAVWRRPMSARDPDEGERAATPLELLFDLCFVVAIAQASAKLHHAVADGRAGSGVVSYLLVFFAIWWAWMNFTLFASAYDNDDVPYRLGVFVQIVGVLILAAGVPRAFSERDFDVVFVGYVVMRIGLVSLWLRAAAHDPGRARRAHAVAPAPHRRALRALHDHRPRRVDPRRDTRHRRRGRRWRDVRRARPDCRRRPAHRLLALVDLLRPARA